MSKPNTHQKYAVARYIANKRAEIEAPDREYIPPPMPKGGSEIDALSPLAKWARHLDGADEHRCDECYRAFPNREPLCANGQALYDASH